MNDDRLNATAAAATAYETLTTILGTAGMQELTAACVTFDPETNETTLDANCTGRIFQNKATKSIMLDIGNDNTSSQQESCAGQEYYHTQYAIVGTFFQTIIFLTGVLGNILVCAVVYRARSMHTTTNCYLVSLAVADTITLVSSVPQVANSLWSKALIYLITHIKGSTAKCYF